MPDERTYRRQEIGAALGRRLRHKRLELGLTVDAVAEAAQVGRAQIVRLERGEGGGSGLDTIAMISKALGVSAGWLAFGDEDRKP